MNEPFDSTPETAAQEISEQVAFMSLPLELRNQIGEQLRRHLGHDNFFEADVRIGEMVESVTDMSESPPYKLYIIPVLDNKNNEVVADLAIGEDGVVLGWDKKEAFFNVTQLDPNRPPPDRTK